MNHLFCRICNKENDDPKHFYRYHELTQAEYFTQYHNRRDKLTNEVIPFKSLSQYFSIDFVNKHNFKKWLKQQPIEVQQDYCAGLLIKRKEEKQLIWTLTQVELRSLGLPGIGFYKTLFGDYFVLCEKLGFKNKFNSDINNVLINPIFNTTLFVDTREQKGPSFKDIDFEIKKLDFGDYSIRGNVVIERKSLQDFLGTLSGGFDRFTREVERASVANCNLIVLVEDTLSNALSFNHLPWISKKIKATSDFIFYNLRVLLQTHNNLQFVFCNGRKEFVRLTKLLLLNEDLFKRDLQYLLDSEQI